MFICLDYIQLAGLGKTAFQTFWPVLLKEMDWHGWVGAASRRSKEKKLNCRNNLEGNVFLSPGAHFHLETESRSMGETVFVNCAHSQCRPALKKPPAPAVSVPATR